MFDDEDYGFLTGGLGDLDGDGKVDFAEYLIEEDDFQRIMGVDDNGYPVSDDEEDDDDWKDIYTDTADELGLDLDDYSDEDEFLEAAEEATEDTDDDENEYDEEYDEEDEDEDVDDEESIIPFKDFDISKLSLTIGANPSLNYDGKPVDEMFGNKNSKSSKQKISNKSIESRYKSRYGDYRIGDAIYDKFSDVRKNFSKNECENIIEIIPKIYSVNKQLGFEIWLWIINNFHHALTSDYIFSMIPQSSQICNYIIYEFRNIDENSDNDYAFDYLAKNAKLETLIAERTYYDEIPIVLSSYIKYCINKNLLRSFERVYFGFYKNSLVANYVKDKAKFIESIIDYYYTNNNVKMRKRFYDYFVNEITTIKKPIREQQLLNKLKDYQECRYESLEDNIPEIANKIIPTKEEPEKNYKELKNENKALKSKVTQLEKQITDLNYNIRRLEADLEAKRKPPKKEWDGKYYRYCKVVMDESPNGLWYRTEDITLKKGDYVFVPYGYQNEELMAKVVLVEEFRSDELPFPLERTKSICYKCDA